MQVKSIHKPLYSLIFLTIMAGCKNNSAEKNVNENQKPQEALSLDVKQPVSSSELKGENAPIAPAPTEDGIAMLASKFDFYDHGKLPLLHCNVKCALAPIVSGAVRDPNNPVGWWLYPNKHKTMLPFLSNLDKAKHLTNLYRIAGTDCINSSAGFLLKSIKEDSKLGKEIYDKCELSSQAEVWIDERSKVTFKVKGIYAVDDSGRLVGIEMQDLIKLFSF